MTVDRRDRVLELALFANIAVHALALASMALLLFPAMPGGPNDGNNEARVAYVALHPWLFRLGWLPWNLCAAADLFMGVAMVRTRWLPKPASIVALIFTSIAVVPDQAGEFLYDTKGVAIAQTGDVAAYLDFEAGAFLMSAVGGALFYTLGALAWTVAFAKAGTWSRALTILSVPLWTAMIVATLSPLAPHLGLDEMESPSPFFIATVNGVGFMLLTPWFILVAEQVFRRARPALKWGRHAPWRYPSTSIVARAVDAVANSRFAAAVCERLPMPAMQSEITDVVYVSYLVSADVAAAMVPPHLDVQRLGPNNDRALFTFLTFRHGHFGPSFLGPLRRLLPSPVQTNWRVHVVDPRTGQRGITFITNAVTTLPHALGARLFTAGMPMHVLKNAAVDRRHDGGVIFLDLDGGAGSAPDAHALLWHAPRPASLPDAWRDVWPDYESFLAYCVPQDRAMSTDVVRGHVARQEIHLGIPLDACIPLNGTVTSKAAQAVVNDDASFATSVCFYVPTVAFRFTGELHDRIDAVTR